jgi:hypothetical protein
MPTQTGTRIDLATPAAGNKHLTKGESAKYSQRAYEIAARFIFCCSLGLLDSLLAHR